MPTPREQLAAMLRQSRLDARFESHGALAKQLNVSRPVVSKAENPVHPVPSDALLAAWADATGAPLDQLTDLAQRAKSGTPDWFVPYRQAESEATVIRSWAPLIVPGLEQTKGYARAVLSAEPYTPEQLDGLLAARLERQQVLQRAYLVSILDAGVLSRWRKASYSGGANGSCVEVGAGGEAVLVRDTTNRGGFTLPVTAAAWSRFTATLR